MNQPNSQTDKDVSLISVKNSILEKLSELEPSYIELINESMQHAGYFEGKESHFKLTIASKEFTNIRLIARHQRIYGLLANLLTSAGGDIHALALHTYTPDEWQNKFQEGSPDSPNCLGKH